MAEEMKVVVGTTTSHSDHFNYWLTVKGQEYHN
jgi:hypothetical protein